jgi:hypothetical protein
MGTTLEQELERAAKRATDRAAAMVPPLSGYDWCERRALEDEAARLRARAARVRELTSLFETPDPIETWTEQQIATLLRSLTGPDLPGTPTGETTK